MMDSGTPRMNSPNGINQKTLPTTGTELCGKLSRLLGKPRLRLMLLSPLLHLRHLVLLSLGQCRRVVFSLL